MKRDAANGTRKLGPADLVRAELRALRAYQVPPSAGMIKVDAMENPYRLPTPLREEIGRIVGGLEINRYPDPAAPELKARLRETFAIPAHCDVMIGNGSDEIIQIVTHALARPEAVVLAPEPSFVMYRLYAVIAHMRYVGVSLNRDFSLDLPRFLDAIAEHQPALVFLAYPNNPTGNLFPEDAILRILETAPGLVVVDEAYHAFTGKTFMNRLGEFPNLMVVRTVSKLGLAGIRLGYAAARPEWVRELDKARPPYNVNVLTQFVAERLLQHVDALMAQAAQIKVDRARFYERLRAMKGVDPFPSEANFILARVPDAERMYEHLKARNILTKNLSGGHPLLANCLRFTIGTPVENESVLAALAERL